LLVLLSLRGHHILKRNEVIRLRGRKIDRLNVIFAFNNFINKFIKILFFKYSIANLQQAYFKSGNFEATIKAIMLRLY